MTVHTFWSVELMAKWHQLTLRHYIKTCIVFWRPGCSILGSLFMAPLILPVLHVNPCRRDFFPRLPMGQPQAQLLCVVISFLAICVRSLERPTVYGQVKPHNHANIYIQIHIVSYCNLINYASYNILQPFMHVYTVCSCMFYATVPLAHLCYHWVLRQHIEALAVAVDARQV